MISVIIPLYNKEQTIVHTLKTVLAQTFTDFEVVIVNDGSTDNGVDAIQSNYTDARIRIIHQKNAGVSAARNRGVQEAQGDWIAFLDADDEWLNTYLQEMYEATQTFSDAKIIGCASYYKNNKTKQLGCNSIIDKYYNKVLGVNYFMNPDKMTHIGATIIDRATFLSFGGFDCSIKINEDLLLIGSLAMNNQYIYVGKMLHVYVGGVDGQATSTTNFIQSLKNSLYVINYFMHLYEESNRKNKLVPVAMKYRYNHILLSLLKKNNKELINFFIDEASNHIKQLQINLSWIKEQKFRTFGIIYIYMTKLFWRCYGFPRVGTKTKYRVELENLYRMNCHE